MLVEGMLTVLLSSNPFPDLSPSHSKVPSSPTMYSECSSTPTLVTDQHISGSGGLPPLPAIRSIRMLEQIFTHSRVTTRPRYEFEESPSYPSRDNEGYVYYYSIRT